MEVKIASGFSSITFPGVRQQLVDHGELMVPHVKSVEEIRKGQAPVTIRARVERQTSSGSKPPYVVSIILDSGS